MASSSYRVEAERWLTIAEKLLTARDLPGARAFAIRARESDPRLVEFSEKIIAIADTLLAAELRINNSTCDYYAILQIGRFTQSMDVIATQYRKLALLLNPTRNRLAFADQAFKLVSDAWMVFSNPSKKVMYDRELQLTQLGHLGPLDLAGQFGQFPQSQVSQAQQTPMRRSPRIGNDGSMVEEETVTHPTQPTFAESDRQANQIRFSEPTRPVATQPIAATPTRTTRPVGRPRKSDSTRRATTQPVATQATEATPTRTTRPVGRPRKADSARPATTQPVAAETTQPTTQPTAVESTRATQPVTQQKPTAPKVPSFWTACPYCYILYEYPKGYEDCALRCQNCKRAFHAGVITPPPVASKDQYFCCWGYFPLGCSGKHKNTSALDDKWSPFAAMFATPLQVGGKVANRSRSSGPKVIYQDDVYIDLSDPSESDSEDDDWDSSRKKVKSARGKATPSKSVKRSQNERGKKVNIQNTDGGNNVEQEGAGKGEGSCGRKKGAKDLGNLDLNVMFNNEEAGPASEGNGAGQREEDNIEGIGFFEGLDEFLSSLPILSVVGDDKVKAT